MMPVNNVASDAVGPGRLVGELVTERPTRARLFERLHIDYCCGGQHTLAEACSQAGLQIETVQAALQTLDEADARPGDADESIDWRSVGTAQLCEHIVSIHHDYLRATFPKIDSLISTVVRVHGAQDSTLADAQRVFEAIRSGLEPHLASEETELFPAIIAAEQGGPSVHEDVLAGHEYEHNTVGTALVELRSLCRDYDHRYARCNTHLALLDALEALEQNIHQHVHEENNVLFRRARHAQPPATDASAADQGEHAAAIDHGQPLPACCQGWVDEQGERWARTRHR